VKFSVQYFSDVRYLLILYTPITWCTSVTENRSQLAACHLLRGSDSTVLTATGFVNGNIRLPHPK